jgi:pimeloyl-ACP methyl ester carboxylesterase
MLALKVVILPATEHNDSAVFPLAGGPGAPVTPGAEDEVKFFAAERRRHDVVLVDERGTGGSAALTCPHAMKAHERELIEGDLFPDSFAGDCRREIEPHADLTAYTFPYFVDDLEALRRALGYGKIDLIGMSYGTRAALTYLERHPDSIRSIFLNGPLAPENHMPANAAADAGAVADRIGLTPKLKQVNAGVIQGDGFRIPVSTDEFAEFVRTYLYDVHSHAKAAQVVAAASSGDWNAIAKDWVAQRRGWYENVPLFLAVTCPTDVRWIPAGETSYRVVRQRAACAQWTPGTVSPVRVPAHSPVPILILTGDLDPVTPPRWAELLARETQPSRVIVLRHSGHVPTTVCAASIEVQFVDTASLNAVDASCAAKP